MAKSVPWWSRIHLTYTSATIVAIIGAVITVAVSFGAHLSKQNIDSIMLLVGLIGAAITVGGGVKTAGLIAAGQPAGVGFHFTPATIVAIASAAVAAAVSFGLRLSPSSIHSILLLVGLIAGGVAVGGGIKSQAMLRAGIHPAQPKQTHHAEAAQHHPRR